MIETAFWPGGTSVGGRRPFVVRDNSGRRLDLACPLTFWEAASWGSMTFRRCVTSW